MTGLTDKQAAALHALAYPHSGAAIIFWHDARASWPGPRKTLGSLSTRGLVEYHDPPTNPEGRVWTITEDGIRELEAHEAWRRRRAIR